jgi:hypothetical protein
LSGRYPLSVRTGDPLANVLKEFPHISGLGQEVACIRRVIAHGLEDRRKPSPLVLGHSEPRQPVFECTDPNNKHAIPSELVKQDRKFWRHGCTDLSETD